MHNTLGLFLLCLFALLPACLKVDATTTLNKNGSGSYSQTSTIELESALAYQQTLLAKAASLGIPEEEAEENPFAEVDAKAQAAALKERHGLSDVRSTETQGAKKKTRTYGLKLKFASLRNLYEAGVIEDTTVTLKQVQEKKAWRLIIQHVFDRADVYEEEEREKEDKREGKRTEPTPQQVQLMKVRRALLKSVEPWWKSIEITRTLTLPSKVLATNGTLDASGRSVTWTLAFKDLVDPKSLRQDVTFAAVEGLKLTPFHLTARDIANAREAFELERDERLRKKRGSAPRRDK